MRRREKAYGLVGESVREIGILIFVFAPLDAFFQAEPSRPLEVFLLASTGLILIAAGITMECHE